MSKAQSVSSDNLIATDRRGNITNFRVPDFQYSTLGMFIIYRLLQNRDAKIVITSKGSTTGTGKTTLAVHLCRWVRRVANQLFDADRQWRADEFGSVELDDYFESYADAHSGDALLPDELEHGADRRRHMSHENVGISQAWAVLRYKNVVSVATLPTINMVDRRLLELGDVWINVVKRGRANTYYLTTDDFTGELIRKRMKRFGYREAILFPEIPEDDRDLSYLHDQKEKMGIPTLNDRITEQDLKETKKEFRNRVVKTLLELKDEGTINIPQHQIGDIANCSQQTVSNIKREMDL